MLERRGGKRAPQEGFQEEEEGALHLRARVELRLGAQGSPGTRDSWEGRAGARRERNPEVESRGIGLR